MRTAPTSKVNVERAEYWLPPPLVAIHRFIGTLGGTAPLSSLTLQLQDIARF
jgi:hypothetical protein